MVAVLAIRNLRTGHGVVRGTHPGSEVCTVAEISINRHYAWNVNVVVYLCLLQASPYRWKHLEDHWRHKFFLELLINHCPRKLLCCIL